MTNIKLTLPYPPSINHYYKTARTYSGIRVYIGKKGDTYRENVLNEIIDYKLKNNLILTDTVFRNDDILEVKIEAFMPDKRKRDIDNLLKCGLDSLQYGGLFNDDFQIKKLTIEKKGYKKNGEIIVSVQKIITSNLYDDNHVTDIIL